MVRKQNVKHYTNLDVARKLNEVLIARAIAIGGALLAKEPPNKKIVSIERLKTIRKERLYAN